MSNQTTQEFHLPLRVYYEDTDAGGIVYYANYLKFCERARTEWLRTAGVDHQTLLAQDGLLFVVAACNIAYRAPARLDDELDVRLQLTRIGRASLQFSQSVWRADTLLCEVETRIACVAAQDVRATPMPEALQARLRACSGLA
ncbi:tol-pal system-associated acyl-CoA thioesterase [Massilia sp. W12]|uniref:tol-pal system-associated acyl-CoA thioesterase n=1 Tax=Massilia sp. W12 TaxID=3126507 RepID=UPI0030D4D5B8